MGDWIGKDWIGWMGLEELGSDALNDNPMLFYHTALDIHQSSTNAGYTTKRTCQETHVIPYEPFTSQAFDGQCEAKLVIRGDEEWTFKRPPVVILQGERHFDMPLLQLAQLKSFGKAPNRFSNTGPVRYVDLRDGTKVARSYREVGRVEDLAGRQQEVCVGQWVSVPLCEQAQRPGDLLCR